MLKPEFVRVAKRRGVVLGTVTAAGGVAYAAASAVTKSESVERRVNLLEQKVTQIESSGARIEGKLDALMEFLKVPVRAREE